MKNITKIDYNEIEGRWYREKITAILDIIYGKNDDFAMIECGINLYAFLKCCDFLDNSHINVDKICAIHHSAIISRKYVKLNLHMYENMICTKSNIEMTENIFEIINFPN